MPPHRSRPLASTKRTTPAERAEEFQAEQRRLKREAAERRAAAAERECAAAPGAAPRIALDVGSGACPTACTSPTPTRRTR